MRQGDRVIYFQPKGFDIPVHRKATIETLSESPIDGKRATIRIDPEDPADPPSRDWVRQSSLQPYSQALWDALDRWVEQQRAHEEAHMQLRKGKIPPALAMASLF